MNTKFMRVVLGGWEESAVQKFSNTSKNSSDLIQWSMLTVPTWSFTFNTVFFGEEEVGYENTEVAKLDLAFKNI